MGQVFDTGLSMHFPGCHLRILSLILFGCAVTGWADSRDLFCRSKVSRTRVTRTIHCDSDHEFDHPIEIASIEQSCANRSSAPALTLNSSSGQLDFDLPTASAPIFFLGLTGPALPLEDDSPLSKRLRLPSRGRAPPFV